MFPMRNNQNRTQCFLIELYKKMFEEIEITKDKEKSVCPFPSYQITKT